MVPAKSFNSNQKITSFALFWTYYLGEHSKPLTRWLHLFGTMAGLLTAMVSLITGNYGGLLVALGLGYGLAWLSHFLVKKNKPATLRYPLWSLLADFKMASLLLLDLRRMAVGKKPNLK